MLSVASAHIALPINRLRYVTHGAGSAQGAACRHPATSRVPCLVSCPAALRLRGPTDSQTRLGRPGKASAATRQKIGARSQCLCGGIFYVRLAKLTNKLAKANKRPGAAGW